MISQPSMDIFSREKMSAYLTTISPLLWSPTAQLRLLRPVESQSVILQAWTSSTIPLFWAHQPRRSKGQIQFLHRILPHKSPSVKSHGTAQSPSRSAIQIPDSGMFHTKTESKDDFDIHNCAFEVAFDECTQLHIWWCISSPQVNPRLAASSCKIRPRE